MPQPATPPSQASRLLAALAAASRPSVQADTRRPLREQQWSGNVRTTWTPPKGLFDRSAEAIAAELASNSRDLKQAMARLTFYRNRAGDNLSDEAASKLSHAAEILHTKKWE